VLVAATLHLVHGAWRRGRGAPKAHFFNDLAFALLNLKSDCDD
jgi:hypothetical protein